MFLLLPHGEDAGDSCSTPFEVWCELAGVHPDDSRAWPLYEAGLTGFAARVPGQPPASTPTAS